MNPRVAQVIQIALVLAFGARSWTVTIADDFQDWEKVIGPFLAEKTNPHGERFSLPILYSHTRDDRIEHREWDVLYPLISFDQYGAEKRLHFFQLLSFSGAGHETGDSETTTVFPFYFHKESPDESQNYHALFPFYGTVKNRLLRDEVKVVAFPLYVQSKKRDVVTDNYLAPFFHLREGNGLKGWQLWPLAGWETKGLTTKTNVMGDVSPVGGHKKLMIAWPIYFHDRTDLETDNPKNHRALLPLFSHFKSPTRTSVSAPWPFGITVTKDEEKKFKEIGAPWPLIVFARGEGKTNNRVWPLFGRGHKEGFASQFYLWPAYRGQELETDYDLIKQHRLLLLLYVDKTETRKTTNESKRRRDLWPLFVWRTTSAGDQEFQLGAPMRPLFPVNETIARHYSPAFALWRSVRSAESGTRSTSFLWNLYRREVREKDVKGSALFGLVRWTRSGEKKSLKFLGLNLRRKDRE